MVRIIQAILILGLSVSSPYFFALLAMNLCKSTLINMKFILFVGTAGMIALPILLKDFVYKFVEWQVVEEIYDFGRATQEEAIHTTYWLAELFLLPAIGGGFFLSIFLFINFNGSHLTYCRKYTNSNFTDKSYIRIQKTWTWACKRKGSYC